MQTAKIAGATELTARLTPSRQQQNEFTATASQCGAFGGRGVRVAAKSSFAFNEPFSTRTFLSH